MAKIYNFRKVRENNIRFILREILRDQPISRSKLAQKAKVSNATVSYIVNSLLSEKLVLETTKGRSTGGRKPVFLEMNSKSKYMIGVDLSDYTVTYAVVDANLEIIYRNQLVMNPNEDVEDNLLRLAKTLKRVFESESEYKDKIIGVGLGISGVYDDKKDRVLTSEIKGIETVRIKNLFSSILKLPIWIENDANLTALAEIMKLKGEKDLFLFYMSKGIGGGIILDDKLYRGESGFAGEISKNVVIIKDGMIDVIGDFFSEVYFKKRCGKEMTLGDVMRKYREKDETVKGLMDDLQRCMTAIFLNMVSLLDIRTIIVGGKYGTFDRAFLRKIERDIHGIFFGKSVRVLPSTLGSDGIILGSAQMVLENYIKENI